MKSDKLFEQVFDCDRVEFEGLDEVSQREAKFLVELKTNLKSLKDVPECQLTTDHLRRAVLSQQLQQARPWKSILAWSPIGLAAGLALVLVTTKAPSTRNISDPVVSTPQKPLIVAKSSSVSNPALDISSEDEMSSLLADEYLKSDPPQRQQKPARRHNVGSTTLEVSTSRTSLAFDSAMSAEKSDNGRDSEGKFEAPKADSAAMPVATISETRTQEPVVIVTETPSSTTGAAEATEISKPSDVVFGG